MIIPFFAICFISFFCKETDSATVLNGVRVSRDFLSQVFLEEIRTNKDLLFVGTRSYDDEKCRDKLGTIINKFPEPEVIAFFDSWGKIPAGVMEGNTYGVGNFDECVQRNVKLEDMESDKQMKSDNKYCFVQIPLKSQNMPTIQIPQWFAPSSNPTKKDSVNIGICVPKSCSPEVTEQIFQHFQFSQNRSGKLTNNLTVSRCTSGKPDPPKAINIIGISVFSIVAFLMTLSSIYDFLTGYFSKTPSQPLLAFSTLSNSKKLFEINVDETPETIICLSGLRVLSMIWVMYCHTFMTSLLFPTINTYYLETWFTNVWSMHILYGTVSVDTFFFLSGLLVAWVGFRELDKTEGNLSLWMMYVHRYVRVTPVVGAVLLFAFSVKQLLYSGPFKYISTSTSDCNSSNWWPILLYISNYFRASTCFEQTWYLAADFQLFVFSPLLLIPMWKWGKKVIPVLVLICLFSIGSVMVFYIDNQFTSFITGTYPEEWRNTYIPTHTRSPPWVIGFGLGYYMHINRGKTFELSKKCQTLGWIVSFSIILAIIYGPHMISKDNHGTVIQAALYEAFKRLFWAIALAWIVFACHHGFGGIINTFLGHPCFLPLSRLTYSLYLIHMKVIRINFGIMRSELFYSNYEMIQMFWGIFGISMIAAVGVTLSFEYPVTALEQYIFSSKSEDGEGNRDQHQDDDQADQTDI